MKFPFRKSSLILLLLLIILCTALCTANTIRAASPSSMTTFANLENDASQWHIFQDQGRAQGSIASIATSNATDPDLAVSLIKGQPYTGIHGYRNLSANNTAVAFQVDLSFEFFNSTPVQALEFTTSKWEKDQRWEWAFQWEHVGDGGPEQGAAPTWRLWSGTGWLNTGLTQQLSAGTWHTLHFTGSIANGRVLYTSFQCDDSFMFLAQTFAPVSSPGNKLAIAVQLDGDSNEDAYKLYISHVNLSVGKTPLA